MNPDKKQFSNVTSLDAYRAKKNEKFGPIAKGIVKRKADMQENLTKIDKERGMEYKSSEAHGKEYFDNLFGKE